MLARELNSLTKGSSLVALEAPVVFGIHVQPVFTEEADITADVLP